MIYISHNLGLILETCDRITVMVFRRGGRGRLGPEVFRAMRMPYSARLFASIPVPAPDKNSRPLVAIPGQLPFAASAPARLQFRPSAAHISLPVDAMPDRSRWCPWRAGISTPHAASVSTRSTGMPRPKPPPYAPRQRPAA
jgi:ABC-type dipeptide/oligopeptide/nickel transport system ATPase component